MRQITGVRQARGARVVLIVSRYHEDVTDRLRAGALQALDAAEVRRSDVTVVAVPGAFEIPQAARVAADTGQFDAVVCLGCVIRGGTPHFEYISSAVAHGIMDAAVATRVPMAFGVLTTNTLDEALARAGEGAANKGWEAAAAAVEMATLRARVSAPPAPGIPV